MHSSKVLMAIFFWTVLAAPLFAQVKVTLPDTTAYPDDTLFVPVNVSDVTGLEIYSYEFRAKFNPGVVHFIGVDSTKTLTETWGKTWLNTEIAGEVRVGNYNVAPLQHGGVLIYLGFSTVGKINDSCQVAIQDFVFNAGQPEAKITNGGIKILHPPITVRFRSNVASPIKILIDGLEKKLPLDTTWDYGSSHIIGTVSPQYLASDTRFSFRQWSDGGALSHTVAPVTDTTFTVIMDEEFLLTLQSSYGTPSGTGWYIRGKSATFSVDSVAQQTANTRYIFAQWSGAGASSYTGPQRTVSIVMNSPVVEIAQWRLQYYLTIRSNLGTPIGQGWHNQSDTVTIAIDSLVIPIAGTRYVFRSWTGTGTGSYTGPQRTATVMMAEPIIQQANWRTEHYLKVTSAPEGIVQFKQSGWYAKNSLVFTDRASERVSSPKTIYHFQHWMLDQKQLSGNPIQVTMDTSHVAEASYRIDSVLVTVTTNIGSGSVVIIDGTPQPAPFSGWWAFQSQHVVTIDSIQMAAHQRTRYRFKSWSDQGAIRHAVMADTNFQLTATLAIEHLLSMDTHPPGLLQFREAGWHGQGQTVAIGPVPASMDVGQEQLEFKGWYLDRHRIDGELHQVQMDRPHSVIAAYQDLLFIKGKITDRRGQIVPGVQVILSGAVNDTAMLSDQGEYAFEMLTTGDYQVVPRGDGVRFEPMSRSYSPLLNSRAVENFVVIDTLKPKIQLIYPNGGERLVAASIDTIHWRATDNIGIDSIAIDFSSDQGQSWSTLVRMGGSTVSFFAWTVPNLSSNHCQIRIIVWDFDRNQAMDLSDGPFSIAAKSAVTDEGKALLPMLFAVEQNYPNPFNSSTQIRFQLPAASVVQIKIFNTLGQVIAIVAERNFEAGHHQIDWDGKDQLGYDVPSGIYFYQVRAANEAVMRRMVLLR